VKEIDPFFYLKKMINKHIYQTFYTKTLPSPIVEIIGKLKDDNPEYSYHFYDDKDIVEFINNNYDEEIRKAYGMLQVGAAKADFWRYLMLYKTGGVYLDLDSTINVPLHTFLNDEDTALFTRERNDGSFVQWAMFYAKEHPVLEKTIELVTNKIFNYKDGPVDQVTGPPVLSKVIEDHYNALVDGWVYEASDVELNTGSDRFWGHDYEDVCTFKHRHAALLYPPFMEKPCWSQDPTPVIEVNDERTERSTSVRY